MRHVISVGSLQPEEMFNYSGCKYWADIRRVSTLTCTRSWVRLPLITSKASSWFQLFGVVRAEHTDMCFMTV